MTHLGFKIIAVLLLVAVTGAMVFQLSDVLRVHALNVHIEVKSTPPGVIRVINRSGEPPPGIVNPEGSGPTAFTTDSDVDSGTDLPGDNKPAPPGKNKPKPPDEDEPTPPAEDKPIPPGITKIIQGTGVPPPGIVKVAGNDGSALYINTDIDFKTVFPEETLTQHFIVGLQGVQSGGPPWWGGGNYTYVCYKITVRAVSGSPYLDLSDNVTVWKDYLNETDNETDEWAIPPDNVAWGTVSANDTTDKWWVTLNAPDITGQYECEIEVRVCNTDNTTTCPPPSDNCTP